jgi:hypothetical protein
MVTMKDDNSNSGRALLLSLLNLSDEHASLSTMTIPKPELKDKLWVVGLPVSRKKSKHITHLLEA